MDLTADWTQQKKGLVNSKTGQYTASKLKYGGKEQTENQTARETWGQHPTVQHTCNWSPRKREGGVGGQGGEHILRENSHAFP